MEVDKAIEGYGEDSSRIAADSPGAGTAAELGDGAKAEGITLLPTVTIRVSPTSGSYAI